MTVTTQSPELTEWSEIHPGWALDVFENLAEGPDPFDEPAGPTFGYMVYAPDWSDGQPGADERWGFTSFEEALEAGRASIEALNP